MCGGAGGFNVISLVLFQKIVGVIEKSEISVGTVMGAYIFVARARF